MKQIPLICHNYHDTLFNSPCQYWLNTVTFVMHEKYNDYNYNNHDDVINDDKNLDSDDSLWSIRKAIKSTLN